MTSVEGVRQQSKRNNSGKHFPMYHYLTTKPKRILLKHLSQMLKVPRPVPMTLCRMSGIPARAPHLLRVVPLLRPPPPVPAALNQSKKALDPIRKQQRNQQQRERIGRPFLLMHGRASVGYVSCRRVYMLVGRWLALTKITKRKAKHAATAHGISTSMLAKGRQL